MFSFLRKPNWQDNLIRYVHCGSMYNLYNHRYTFCFYQLLRFFLGDQSYRLTAVQTVCRLQTDIIFPSSSQCTAVCSVSHSIEQLSLQCLPTPIFNRIGSLERRCINYPPPGQSLPEYKNSLNILYGLMRVNERDFQQGQGSSQSNIRKAWYSLVINNLRTNINFVLY